MGKRMSLRVLGSLLTLCVTLVATEVSAEGDGSADDTSLQDVLMGSDLGAVATKSVPGARVIKRNPRQAKVTKVVSKPEPAPESESVLPTATARKSSKQGPFNFVAPVKRRRITSKYGHRRHPKTKRKHLHKGTDYGGKKGTPVLSTGPGKIVHAGWGRNRANGIFIIVEHPGGWESYYLHLSKVEVKRGDIVKAGEKIGRIGNTGRSTGPHLHFQLQRKGRTVNPEKVIGKRSDRVRPSH